MRNRSNRRTNESLFSNLMARFGPVNLPGSTLPRGELASEGMHFISDELMRFLSDFNMEKERAKFESDHEQAAHSADLEREASELSAAVIKQARHRSRAVIALAKTGYATQSIDSESGERALRAERLRPGAFEAFMLERPSLAAKTRALCAKELGRAAAPSLRRLHKEFLASLRQDYGIAGHEYPFVLVGQGYRSFCRWVQRSRLLDKEGQQ